MSLHSAARGGGLRDSLIGYFAALALTLIPFALVATRSVAIRWTLTAIAACGFVQILVHLRYFLHLDFRKSSRARLLAIGFAAVVIFIMAGGTAWIMIDLHTRMVT